VRLSRTAPGPQPLPASRSTRLVPLALAAALLAGCSAIGNLFGDDKPDYRGGAAKVQPLEVPPDLTQLARESRYQPQSGVVSAAAVAANAATASQTAAAGGPVVAPTQMQGMRLERDGLQRWLFVPKSPDQLWPQLRAFWERSGFTLAVDNPQTGVLETNWSENRAKLPDDVVRNTIGKLLRNLYDTGERDMYRMRIERVDGGSEISIAHRGIAEVYTDERHENTAWQLRPNDPGLEAEMLSRVMLALAGGTEVAKKAAPAVTATTPVPPVAVPQTPARARTIADAATAALEVDEPFDRAWRRVGIALDRGGFTVEDRDRAQGLYYVRYIDPTTAGKDEPGFFAKLFGAKAASGAVRYRIALEAKGSKTTVRVLTSAGAPENGDNGKRIVALLVDDLR